jgi:hypothetical protein
MTLLNTANRLYSGIYLASKAYLANTQVWPAGVFAKFEAASAANVTLSGSNLVVTNTASGMANQGVHVAVGSAKTTGKHYYEARLLDWATGGSVGIGGIGTSTTTYADQQNGAVGGIMCQSAGGQIWANFTIPANIGSRSNGDVVGFAIDLTNRKFWCHVAPAGPWNGSGTADPVGNVGGITIPAGPMVPFCTFGGVSTGPGNIVSTNFGSGAFLGLVPVGFTSGWLA